MSDPSEVGSDPDARQKQSRRRFEEAAKLYRLRFRAEEGFIFDPKPKPVNPLRLVLARLLYSVADILNPTDKHKRYRHDVVKLRQSGLMNAFFQRAAYSCFEFDDDFHRVLTRRLRRIANGEQSNYLRQNETVSDGPRGDFIHGQDIISQSGLGPEARQ